MEFIGFALVLDLVIAMGITVAADRLIWRLSGWILTPFVMALAVTVPFMIFGGESRSPAYLALFILCLYGSGASSIGALAGYLIRRFQK
jgi:hypothetical protein